MAEVYEILVWTLHGIGFCLGWKLVNALVSLVARGGGEQG